MESSLFVALAGLALVDSLSFGTLVLPLAMLTAHRVLASRMALYLATIAGFYWVLGVMLVLASTPILGALSSFGDSRSSSWAQLVLGLSLLTLSFWPDTPWAKRRAREEATAGGRHSTWRAVVSDPTTPASGVVAVALVAGLVEAATMFPYLGAVGLISTQVTVPTSQFALLGAYVVLMCAPALALLSLRLGFASRLEPRLARLEEWLGAQTGKALWWAIGIIGALLALNAAQRLDLLWFGR